MTPQQLLQAFVSLAAAVLVAWLFALRGRRARSQPATPRFSGGPAPASASQPPSATLHVFFGTQTGTAERFAKELAAEVRRRYGGRCGASVVDVERLAAPGAAAAALAPPACNAAVFLQATYGDGEPTDTAAAFCAWAARAASDAAAAAASGAAPAAASPLLSHLRYAVFALGNRQYEHFAAAGLRLDASLGRLGASRLLPAATGDDDAAIDDDFRSWRAALWPALERALPSLAPGGGGGGVAAAAAASSPAAAAATAGGEERRGSEDAGGDDDEEEEEHPWYEVTMLPAASAAAQQTPPPAAPPFGAPASAGGPFDARRPLLAVLSSRTELLRPGGPPPLRSVLHLEFDTCGAVAYQPGDHVGLWPLCDPADVALACGRAGVAPGDLCAVAPHSTLPPPPFPLPCSAGDALARWAELRGGPRAPGRAALRLLAKHCGDPADAAFLRRLGAPTPAGRAAHAAWAALPGRGVATLLAAAPSLRPPLGVLLACAPRTQPRFYSISSAPSLDGPRVLTVTAAVVRFGGGPAGGGAGGSAAAAAAAGEGLATGHLARLAPGRPAALFVRPSHFRLPPDPSAPLVMVGPGTGVAPFRAFLRHRSALASAAAAAPAASAPARLGPALLFFGCRDETSDFLYGEELRAHLRAPPGAPPGSPPPLTALHVAVSRPPPPAARAYVQDAIARPGVWPAVEAALRHPAGALYVCGDARAMARDVHRALAALLGGAGGAGGGPEEGERWLAGMQAAGRYQRDVW